MSMMSLKRNSGFTLVEVLVAVVVLGIGLTGMAGLQIVSMRGSQQAYTRTQATIMAYDIIDRMRSNVAAARAGEYDTAFADDVTALALCFGPTANCTPAQFADHDRRQWRQQVNAHLSSGTGSIATVTAAGQTTVNLSLRWVDSDADVDADGDVIPQQMTVTVRL